MLLKELLSYIDITEHLNIHANHKIVYMNNQNDKSIEDEYLDYKVILIAGGEYESIEIFIEGR